MTAKENPLAGMDAPGQGEDHWEPPVPFDSLSALPSFPDDALPAFLRGYCQSMTTSVQVPYDLPALMTLGVVSCAVAGKIEIEVKDGYREPLNLWLFPVLESGNRKTMIVGLAKSPIVAWEAEQETAMGPDIAQARTLYDIRQAGLQKAKAQAASVKSGADERLIAEADAIALAQEVESLVIPAPPRLLTADVTAEALASLIAAHHGCMSILSDEGDIFKLMAGRYSSGIPNIGIYKAGHAGGEYLVDRVNRPAVKIPKALLTIAVSPQPITVKGLTLKPEFRGEGLIARMMFSYPRSRIGTRTSDTPALDQGLATDYARRLRALLNLETPLTPEGWYDPYILILSPEARVRWMRFFDTTEARLGEGRDLYSIRDWGSKLNGTVARLAGVLHMATHALRPDAVCIPVAGETMLAAIQIGVYFIPHALYAFSEMGAGAARGGAQVVLDWIERKGDALGPDRARFFKESELWQDLHRRFEERKTLTEALIYLAERDYVRLAPLLDDGTGDDESQKRKAGRPASSRYHINPITPIAPEKAGLLDKLDFLTGNFQDKEASRAVSIDTFSESFPSGNPIYPINSSAEDDDGDVV